MTQHPVSERLRFILWAVAVFIINVAVDQTTKLLAVQYLKDIPPISFFSGIMLLTYAENSGAFLSMGASWHPVFKHAVLLYLPLAVCLYGVYWCLCKERSLFRLILLMTIIGGGLSNLVDRIFNDFRVIDFLNFGIGRLRTGILNVADLSVTFGAIILVLWEIREDKKRVSP